MSYEPQRAHQKGQLSAIDAVLGIFAGVAISKAGGAVGASIPVDVALTAGAVVGSYISARVRSWAKHRSKV